LYLQRKELIYYKATVCTCSAGVAWECNCLYLRHRDGAGGTNSCSLYQTLRWRYEQLLCNSTYFNSLCWSYNPMLVVQTVTAAF